MKFTGHERDGKLGLDYMMARYYSAGLARFLSVDPGNDTNLENPQSWDLYVYVHDNPVNATDPKGTVSDVMTGLFTDPDAIARARMNAGSQKITSAQVDAFATKVVKGADTAETMAEIGHGASIASLPAGAPGVEFFGTGLAVADSVGILAKGAKAVANPTPV